MTAVVEVGDTGHMTVEGAVEIEEGRSILTDFDCFCF